jgi:hypothetical protein
MITSRRFSVSSIKIMAVGFAASSIFAMAIPAFAHAASYAFVNQSNDVSFVIASDPMSALANALNIAFHSGVMLLTNQNSGIVGSSL